MPITANISSQIVVQTAAQWVVDATVYSAKRVLVTSDVFYGATDQRQFKIADGVQTWANLDYMPIGTVSDASETVKGIVQEATQAEFNAGTDTGSTGARLFSVPSKIQVYLVATYQSIAGLFASVMALVLTGFAAGANIAVAATDTLAQALAKFQGQINARPNETATTIAAINHAAAVKAALVDADEITGQDSASSFSLIRTTWTSVKAFLKTYFDTLYAPIASIGFPSVSVENYGGTVNTSASIHVSMSGAGTGASTINLWTAAPDGTVIIISDTDCKSATNNITLDAGAAKFIAATSQAQTYTMNINGTSIMLQRVSSTVWKII